MTLVRGYVRKWNFSFLRHCDLQMSICELSRKKNDMSGVDKRTRRYNPIKKLQGGIWGNDMSIDTASIRADNVFRRLSFV